MKSQSTSRLLFDSEDIKIQIQENSDSENNFRSYMIEDKSSFNLLFLLSPGIHLEANKCGKHFIFKKSQYILHYSSQETEAELWTEAQGTLKYLQIQINYPYIFNLINPESNSENADILKRMISNNYMFLHKETPPDMTVEMHMILKEIMNYSQKGVMQKLLVEAKVIKLLFLIFEQFNEKNIVAGHPKIPSLIKKYIDENYHRNINAEEIGRMVGINQNRIRREFKKQYHVTVADYISELRMLKAKKMIIDKSLMIKEISIECGYEYVQNFTRAFKKKFGVSPDRLRNE